MTISSTSSDTSIWQLLQTSLSSTESQATTSTSASDSSSVSDPGQLFSELEKLSKSNPTEFKSITAQIADQLKTAASNTTDSNEASFLNQVASNFETASQSGQFSDLLPHNASQGASQQAGSHSGHHYGPPPNDDTLNSVFASALTQIQTDLSNSNSTSN